MQEFQLTGPRQIAFMPYDEPPLQAGQVRLRSIMSGIKHGTEIAIYRGVTPFIDAPFDPEYRLFTSKEGYSFFPTRMSSMVVSEITEVAPDVTRLKVGDRVVGGMWHRPTNVWAIDRLHVLPADMRPESAMFLDPTLFALAAVHDAQIKVGDNVAIFGMGALGLMAVQIARMNGAETIFAIDALDSRRDLARQLGADVTINARSGDAARLIKDQTGKKGVDVAIEISGAYAALQSAIRCVHVCGLIVAASFYAGAPALQLGAEWHHNRPTLISSMPVWGMPHRRAPMWDLKRLELTAFKLLTSGKVQTKPLIASARHYPYAKAAEAYRMIDEQPESALKTFLVYE